MVEARHVAIFIAFYPVSVRLPNCHLQQELRQNTEKTRTGEPFTFVIQYTIKQHLLKKVLLSLKVIIPV